MTTGLLAVAAFGAGLCVRRLWSSSQFARRAWLVSSWTVSPTAVYYGFSTVPADRTLVTAFACAVAGSWLALSLAWAYARVVASDTRERGALTLGGAFGNTGTLGYPVAQVLFGQAGLGLMVVYDFLRWLLPTQVVSTWVASVFASESAPGGRRRLVIAVGPSIAAAILGSTQRGVGGGEGMVEIAGAFTAVAVVPASVFLLGLTVSLERLKLTGGEAIHAAGAMAVRSIGGPACLFACGALANTKIPAVFYVGAAMPAGFHLIVLATVFDLRPNLMRTIVVSSSAIAIAFVLIFLSVN